MKRAALLILFLAGCGNSDPVVPSVTQDAGGVASDAGLPDASSAADASSDDAGATNHSPVLTLQPTSSVDEGQRLEIEVAASDPDGDALTFDWKQTGGPSVTLKGESAAKVSFTAPAVTGDAVVELSVEVCDPSQACATASTSVTVKEVNSPPQISSVSATPNPVNEGKVATLRVVAADPDGDALTYQWKQTDGPTAVLTDADKATATFVAPGISADDVLSFEVQVCDQTECAKLPVQVDERDTNKPPTVTMTVTPNPARAGEEMEFFARVQDAEGDHITYQWTQTGGPAIPDWVIYGGSYRFVVPAWEQDETVTLEVEACDEVGQCVTKSASGTVLGTSTYVSPAGNDTTGQGTRAKPWRTISRALAAAVKFGFPAVRVAEGDYPEAPAMAKGVRVECGYQADLATDPPVWIRPTPRRVSRILTTSAQGVHFPAGADGVLDGCQVRIGTILGPQPSTLAAITVEAASPTLLEVDADASTSAALTSVALAAQGGTASVTTVEGGRFVGGTSPTSIGIVVGAGMRLVLGGKASVAGTPGVAAVTSPLRALGIDVGEGGSVELGGEVGVLGGTTAVAVQCTTPCSAIGLHLGAKAKAAKVTGATITGGSSPLAVALDVEAGPSLEVTGATITGRPSGATGNSTSIGLNLRGAGTQTVSGSTLSGGGASGVAVGVHLTAAGVPVLRENLRISGCDVASPTCLGVLVEEGTATFQKNALIEGGPAQQLAVGAQVRGGKPEFVENKLIRGAAQLSGAASSAYVVGMHVAKETPSSAAPSVSARKNVITGGHGSTLAAGVVLMGSAGATLNGNAITGGSSLADTWGVADTSFDGSELGLSTQLALDGNVIHPTASGNPERSMGLVLRATGGTVTNNLIFGGHGTVAVGALLASQNSMIGPSVVLGFANNVVDAQGASTSASVPRAFALQLSNLGLGTLRYGALVNNILLSGRTAPLRGLVVEYGSMASVDAAEFHNNDLVADAGAVLYRPDTGADLTTLTAVDAHAPNYGGNLNADPKFVSEATGDYHLTATSPCIDHGQSAGAPATDLDGEARPKGLGVDIGADEH